MTDEKNKAISRSNLLSYPQLSFIQNNKGRSKTTTTSTFLASIPADTSDWFSPLDDIVH